MHIVPVSQRLAPGRPSRAVILIAGAAALGLLASSPAFGASTAMVAASLPAATAGVSVPGGASVALSPDGTRMYVSFIPAGPASASSRGIAVVDADSMTVLTSMTYDKGGRSSSSPSAVVSSDGARLYALDDAGATIIDTATMTTVGRLDLPRYSWEGLGLSTAGSMLPNGTGPFALSSGSVQPSRCADVDGCSSPPLGVDLKRPTDTTGDIASLGVNGLGKRLVMAADGAHAYVLVQIGWADANPPTVFGAIDLPDASTRVLTPRWATTSGSPVDVAISADGARAYLATPGYGSAVPGWVSVVDVASMTELGTIPLATSPVAIAVTAEGLRAYIVGSDQAGTVSVLDLAAPQLAPSAPLAVTVKPRRTSATVSWKKPAAIGAAAITGYRVTASPRTTRPCVTAKTSCTFSGLRAGKTYSFTVSAVSAAGAGAGSAPVARRIR